MDKPIIFIIRKNIHVNSAESFISRGLQDGFKELGHKCFIISSLDEINKSFENILIIDDLCNYTSLDKVDKLKNFNHKGAIFALWVHWPIADEKLKVMWEDLLLNHTNIFQIFYGEREEISMHNFSKIINRKYYVIPNASPKEVSPSSEDLRKRNNFDIVFIGAKYKTKSFLFEKVIPKLKQSGSNKISIGLFGKGFNKRVTVSNGIIKFLNKTIKVINPVMTNNINNKISKFGTVISEGREPLIYKNSKICINYHEDNPNHIIYNMRYFKIPYYGGFQIVDSPLDKSPYFKDDEVVHISSKKVSDWVDTINFYLQNSHERLKIQQKGFLKAKKMHSYANRAIQFVNIYEQIRSNVKD